MRSSDTSPEARALQDSLWRKLGGEQRVLLAFEMSDEALRISLDGLRERRGGSARDHLGELILRMHGVDIQTRSSTK